MQIPHRIRRLKARIKKARHDAACRGIYAQPHGHGRDADYCIASLLSRQDMVMYLLALKSLTKHVGWPRQVHVVNDGSLRDGDITILRGQIPNLVVTALADIDTGQCPQGSCWERLCYILDLSASTYVIQMDSDTVTLSDLTEVAACIAANRSFTMGTHTGQEIETVAAARERVSQWTDTDHVQVVAEMAMGVLPDQNLLYVRGSAGFAGFAKGVFSRQSLESFSMAMEDILGSEKWNEWGSEQAASNFMIANAPDALVLKSPRYVNHFPDIDISQAAFVHFVGAHRYDNGNYLRLSRHILNELAMEHS